MRKDFTRKVISVFLCIALIMSYVPITAMAASSGSITRIVDPSTLDGWKEFFLPDNLSTENAGGVWTDKSVLADGSELGANIEAADDGFLVALSTIAANMTVTGMSNVPTDTMLVLDVSGSMNDNEGNNDVAEELVEAANESIAELLATNKHNRIGVVLYSGPTTQGGAASNSDAVLMLPLGRYTTGSDDEYLSYTVSGRQDTTETVSLDSSVVYEGTNRKPTSQSKTVVGGTYIQKGIILAKDQFVATSNTTTVEDATLGTLTRKPIMVLMSDGAPTVASTNFTTPSTINLGDGTNTSAAIGFVTQLSAAYAKQQIEAKYNSDCLFYTLGLGTGNDSVATSVLNPASSSNAIDDFWEDYNDVGIGRTVTVQGSGSNAKRVTKIANTLIQNYVDKYFAVSANSNDLAADLKQAFKDIVGAIQLQSKYFPTLISENEDLSGYVSFVDKIGEYMNVTDIKGIFIDNVLHSGAALSRNFAAGGNGGALGTYDNPTDLGHEMVSAVQARLGLRNADQARTLIGLAYEYGQISYTSDTEFSNYIGWYANAAGEFLGFWYEGITTMPDPADPTLTDATRPVYIMKSYGYLGEVDEEHGVSESDMMYATVQLREDIVSGEQTVAFAIPAALIPIITYNVTLDEDRELAELTATGAEHPIRLVYEVALDEKINEFNVKDVVSADYLAENTNPDGSVNFYTNQYELNNTTGYGTVNTYTYFNPSRQNDKYYYIEDAPVYVDNQGALYKGNTQPSGEKYRSYTVYKKVGNNLVTETVYRRLSDAALSTAVRTEGTNNWHIPKGNVHVNLDGYTVYKSDNATDTLTYSNIPFVDTTNHTVNDLGYNFYVGATHGNNGKLTLEPATGIKLTKAMASTATAPDEAFEFVLTNTTNATDSSVYPAYIVLANGTEYETSIAFSGGKATVALNAGDVLYIGGMTDGDVIEIEETDLADYVVESVNGNANADSINITIEENVLANANFVNADRGKGNLAVSKVVEHDFGTAYQIPADKEFEITITLNGIGTKNATFKAEHTNGSITSVTTDADGKITVTLKHEEHFEIFDLPEGTVANVVEDNIPDGFTPAYWENGAIGDGEITVNGNTTASVIVVNDYEADEVYPVNVVLKGAKNYENSAGWTDEVFEFVLQKWNGTGWQIIGTQTVNKDKQSFDFSAVLGEEEFTTPGIYSYQVIETNGGRTIDGITYDATAHTFGVVVADADMDGQLEITRVVSYHTGNDFSINDNGDWEIDITFNNSYNASGCTAVIDIQKELINNSNSSLVTLAGFQFELLDGNGVQVTKSEYTDGAGEARLILNYDLEDVGTHTYTLKEIVPANAINRMEYSEKEYEVVIEVGTDAGLTYAEIISISDGTEAIEIPVFTNTYDPADTELTIDFVEKELSGRTLRANEFTFEVQSQSGATLLTGKNDADGDVNFNGTLKFDKVGIYFFNILETSTNRNGVTVDKNVYNVTVTVSDNNGQLTASYDIVNVVGDEIVFYNTYNADDVSFAISGNKTLNGRTLLNNEFTFILTEAIDADGTIPANAKTYEANNFISGRFRFPEITYTDAGTYYYVVSEKAASGSSYGIVFDDTQYVVTVKITDNGEGELLVNSVDYKILGNGVANAIAFTNEYIPNATSANIPGNKELEGKILANGQFSFELYQSNANWVEGTKIETVQNAQDGTFEFSAIDLDKAGRYYYLVKEVNGGETIDGVTYDDTVFRVRIDVTDDLIGQLHAEIHIYDNDGIPQESIEFRNIYTVTGNASVTIDGTKTLNGRNMNDGEFTFELYSTDFDYEIAGNPIDTATNTDGEFAFNFNFEPEDIGTTFYYAVIEKNDEFGGIAYDTTQYNIAIQVEDDGVGGIRTITDITDGENPTASLDFVNEYIATPAETTISGEKVLEGRELEAEEFTFNLYEADEEFTIIGEAIDTAVNDADGYFAFENLIFEEAGEYFYVVTEDASAEAEGITYDTTVYKVAVFVTDTLEGELVIEKGIFIDEENTAEEIIFTNVFTPEPEPEPTPEPEPIPDPEIPNTDAADNLSMWFAALFVSGGGILSAFLMGKKKKGEVE